MTKKDRVENITPFHAELKFENHGFCIEFYSPIGDDYSRRKITKVHFESWWSAILAQMLWKVVDRDQRSINEIKATLRGD